MAKIVKLSDLSRSISEKGYRSAWKRGVRDTALDILGGCECESIYYESLSGLRDVLSNGAPTLEDLSYGGCMLVYNADIAARYCSPSELKKVMLPGGGVKSPNRFESWLDVQARACCQAWRLIVEAAGRVSVDGSEISVHTI